jgi:hypothetical protein
MLRLLCLFSHFFAGFGPRPGLEAVCVWGYLSLARPQVCMCLSHRSSCMVDASIGGDWGTYL